MQVLYIYDYYLQKIKMVSHKKIKPLASGFVDVNPNDLTGYAPRRHQDLIRIQHARAKQEGSRRRAAMRSLLYYLIGPPACAKRLSFE